MVFEVKATHRVASTGASACEVHPDVFVDEWSRVLVTDPAVVEDVSIPGGLVKIGAENDEAFVVDDEAIELTVDWMAALSGDTQAGRRIRQRTQQRWATSPELVPCVRPDVDWESLPDDERTVMFDVRASHHISGRELACEIYPDVFVGECGRGAYSRLAGMAMQQPGDFAGELPEGTQEWFRVHGLKNAVDWLSTVAQIRDEFWLKQHGGETFLRSPVGPMGPQCPPRRFLPR